MLSLSLVDVWKNSTQESFLMLNNNCFVWPWFSFLCLFQPGGSLISLQFLMFVRAGHVCQDKNFVVLVDNVYLPLRGERRIS